MQRGTGSMDVDLLTQEVPPSPVCFLHLGDAMGALPCHSKASICDGECCWRAAGPV